MFTSVLIMMATLEEDEGEKQWSISGLAKQIFFCFLNLIALYNFLQEKVVVYSNIASLGWPV